MILLLLTFNLIYEPSIHYHLSKMAQEIELLVSADIADLILSSGWSVSLKL